MTRRMRAGRSKPFGWGKLLLGIAVMLLVPALIIAGLWSYASLINTRAASAPLSCQVSQTLMFGEPNFDFTARFTAPSGKAAPQQLDIVVLVDVSGSMKTSLPHIAAAVNSLADQLLESGNGNIRLSLVRFDVSAVIDTTPHWTADREVVAQGLRKLAMIDGANDTREAFRRLRELLDESRPGARKMAVFFTDGELVVEPNVMPWPEMESEAKALRTGPHALRLFAIGLPGSLNSNMMRITGDEKHLLSTSGLNDFSLQLRNIALQELSVFARDARLQVPLHGTGFAAAAAPATWQAGDGESLVNSSWTLIAGANAERLPLRATSIGLWPLGNEGARLSWRKADDASVGSAACAAAPMVLIIPWWLILLALLPPLAYLAWGCERLLRRRKSAEPQPLPLPPLPATPDVEVLPLPPAPQRPGGRPPVPTLAIGLGGEGAAALRQLTSDVEHHMDDGRSGQFVPLVIDLEAAAGTLSPPRAACDLTGALDAVPSSTRTWFDPKQYQHAARSDLDLSHGARGDRKLARLVVARWLEQDELPRYLDEALASVAGLATAEHTFPQILLLTSAGGGFGSGAVIDLARLLRRLDQRRIAEKGGRPAEIIAFLAISGHSPNEIALLEEFAQVQNTGRYPLRTTFRPGDPLLDAVDRIAPVNLLAAIRGSGTGQELVEPALALLDFDLREAMIRHQPAFSSTPVELAARSLILYPNLLKELVANDLTLRMLSDLLPSLEAAPDGGYRLSDRKAAAAGVILEQWAADDETSGPWHSLLAATTGSLSAEELDEEIALYGNPGAEWFLQALSVSFTSLLSRNRSNPPGLNELAACLRLLAERCGAFAQPAFPVLVPAILHLADQIDGWVAALLRGCGTLAARRKALFELEGASAEIPGRVMICSGVDGPLVESMGRHLFDDLAGNTSAGRFLSFGTALSQGEVVLRLHCGLVKSRSYGDGAEAVTGILADWGALAASLPSADIYGALAEMDPAARRNILGNLVETVADGVVTALPRPARKDVAFSLDLAGQMPEPTGTLLSERVASSARAAIRRLAWAALPPTAPRPATTLPLAQELATTADSWRSRLQDSFLVDLPPLPVPLAVALLDRERFHCFATAYRDGLIRQDRAADGTLQWRLPPPKGFLTRGDQSSLADAAASFALMLDRFTPDGSGVRGDFSALEAWLKDRTEMASSADVLTLAAIQMELR
ncbi:vWA domain-containing protein [Paramagnetospirillum magneticum]|uniref:VWFA domain-containing protein n=1 Tax=Paramagnetospirillum magneticum (strain ATCC 700264 / AMB-1) TaxID=342108 RepID=Q2W312_PARM1|nr:vWA domain-containing protein [Paramagnetospirillum magneticum]BAE51763.1 hypothetical protein amb2959 [Paramagnetospirillum magneticum AMB-1]